MQDGSYDQMRDLILQVVGISENKPQGKLSEHIMDLNLGTSYKDRLDQYPGSNQLMFNFDQEISDEDDISSTDFDEYGSNIIPYLQIGVYNNLVFKENYNLMQLAKHNKEPIKQSPKI